MTRIGVARRCSCVVLAVAALAACDRSSVPLPERKTATPSAEPHSDAAPAHSKNDGARGAVPAIPPDTATGKAIDGPASAPATR